jgi:hypothetical protein
VASSTRAQSGPSSVGRYVVEQTDEDVAIVNALQDGSIWFFFCRWPVRWANV